MHGSPNAQFNDSGFTERMVIRYRGSVSLHLYATYQPMYQINKAKSKRKLTYHPSLREWRILSSTSLSRHWTLILTVRSVQLVKSLVFRRYGGAKKTMKSRDGARSYVYFFKNNMYKDYNCIFCICHLWASVG